MFKIYFGSPSSGPTTYTLDISGSVTPVGSLIKQDQKSITSSTSIAGLIIKGILKTLVSQIIFTVSQSSDDGRELSSGAVSLTTGVLSATDDLTWFAFRFRNIFIPTGSLILSASMTVEVISTSSDSPAFDIYAEKLSNPTVLTTTNNDISDRTKTTSKTTWSASDIGAGQKTSPGLETIIQEVVDSVGIDGNVVIIWDSLSGVNFSIVSYDGSPSVAPKLTIETNIGSFTSASGSLLSQPSKLLSGTVNIAADIINQITRALSITAEISLSGLLVKSLSRIISGEITPAGTSVSSLSKLLSGTIGSVGSVLNQIDKSFLGSIPLSGSLVRSIDKFLLSSNSIIGVVTNQISRSLSGTINSEGGLTAIRLVLVELSGIISSSGSLLKSISVTLISATSISGTVLKMISRELSGSVASSSTVSTLKSFLLTLNASISSSGSISKVISKLVSGSVSISGSLIKNISRTLSGAITSTSNLIRTFTHVLSGTVGTVGNPDSGNQLYTTGTITSTGSLTKSAGKLLGGILTPVGSANKFFSQVFNGSIAISGILSATLVGLAVVQTIGRAMFRGMFRKMR